jgi:hypothetical protein
LADAHLLHERAGRHCPDAALVLTHFAVDRTLEDPRVGLVPTNPL